MDQASVIASILGDFRVPPILRDVGTPLKTLTQRKPPRRFRISRMAITDATTATTRWTQSAGSAQQRFVEGVQSTTKDPGTLAAAQAQKMLNGVTQAVTSGYWQRRVVEGGATWKQRTVDKAANYGVGIQAGASKYQQGYTNFWNYMGSYYNQLQSMPKNSIADSVARASFWITNAANYQKP